MNVIESRKEQQRLARENLILENAAHFMAQNGFQNLNLDALALSVAYSKGTLYLHFKTKEDLALAVSTRALSYRTDLLERATTFSGSTREKARAMGIACCQFANAYPEFFEVELMLHERSFWERVSVERQEAHLKEGKRLFGVVYNLVLEAIKEGNLPRNTDPEEVTLSMMAITMGSHYFVTRPHLQSFCDIKDKFTTLCMHQDRMLDGWAWKPISAGNRHTALDRRILKEIFPEATWYKS